MRASGAIFGRDSQHVYDCGAEDLMHDPTYAAATGPAQALAVWMRASTKRLRALLDVQRLPPLNVIRPKRNVASNPTRFSEKILTFKRELELAPTYQQLQIQQAARNFLDPVTFVDFTARHAALAGSLPVLNMLILLLRSIIQLTPRLGSDVDYTTSIRTFRHIIEHVARFKADPLIGTTAVAFK